jgi:hypothetical protein
MEKREEAPYLALPEMKPRDYPQKFVHAPNPNKPGPNNKAAMEVSGKKVMEATHGR